LHLVAINIFLNLIQYVNVFLFQILTTYHALQIGYLSVTKEMVHHLHQRI